ncbi:MAG: 3-hydroxyacyl-ACP dehydratase FabZ family protein [Saprospiraceae bacterium]
MTAEKIISLLPYTKPFLFVDNLEEIQEDGVIGTYTYPPDSYFYEGHFINNPITPGVILTETMAQIGLVCLCIFLIKHRITKTTQLPAMVMVSNETNYFLPVYPGEKVTVISKKEYFRFGKLKCQVEMRNEQNELVCKGIIAGMVARK